METSMVSSVNTDGQLHELTSEQRNALIAQYMPLARSIAAKKHRQIRSVDIDELRSAAYLGLVEAASRYESARGNFYSYAVLRIGGEVQDCLRSLGFGSKGSVSRGCQRFASLDAGGDGETSPVASVEATGGDLRVVFDEITEVLPPQGKKVMWLYYVEGRKMKEIGDGLGLAESRVSQLIAGYKKRLRAAEHGRGPAPAFFTREKRMDKTMDIYSPRGTKVRYTGKNGYDHDKEYADQHLVAGEVYTVRHTDVGGWETEVFLEEVPGLRWGFNSVHFAPVEVAAEEGTG